MQKENHNDLDYTTFRGNRHLPCALYGPNHNNLVGTAPNIARTDLNIARTGPI